MSIMTSKYDTINIDNISSLSDLFFERVKRSSDQSAYCFYDNAKQSWTELTWNDIAKQVERWHTAFRHEGLETGDRVAIMMRNCPEWVIFDQAAYSLGLVVVPLYTNDRTDNIAFILNDANVKLLLIEDPSICDNLLKEDSNFNELVRVITYHNIEHHSKPRLVNAENWLPSYAETIERVKLDADSLATIVYTSGTTGRPKGVMLSHNNMLSNACAGAMFERFYTDDIFLSFLPLSHMFERTAGYYLPMVAGSKITYARSIELLAEDLLVIRPSILVTVPRIFERVYNKIHDQLSRKPAIANKLFELAVKTGWHRFLYQQKRENWQPGLLLWPLLNKLVAGKIIAKLGGNLRLAISGGAPLAPEIAKTFIGLGLTITQGYGLTESSPIISTNKLDDNDPFSVGHTLAGVEVKLGDNDELLVKGPNIMLGYWNNDSATKEAIDQAGWLHTGDKAKIKDEHIYITGRIKEIIVLANGEKVPPSDLELAIMSDPLFEQVVVIGEAKPFLTAIITLDENSWNDFASSNSVSPDASSLRLEHINNMLLERVNNKLASFPGYTKIIRIHVAAKPWSIEDGFITPTLKIKKEKIFESYRNEINELYRGH